MTPSPLPPASRAAVLEDGRTLAYTAQGPASGAHLLYFHGTPASKHNWYLNHDDDLLEELGLRVLALDRPGIGGSSHQAGRTLRDWPEDVRAFADRLGLERFAVLGYSCGAPYALACALRLSDRVTHTTVVSGLADLTHPELASLPSQPNLQLLRLGHERPWASRLAYHAMDLAARLLPGPMIEQARSAMPAADGAVLAEPAVQAAFLEMLRETFRQGPRGPQVDSAIVGAGWGLELERIPGPVRLWHGDADENVPVALARHQAGRLPNAELTVVPDEGHLSLVRRHTRRILGAIPAAASGSAA